RAKKPACAAKECLLVRTCHLGAAYLAFLRCRDRYGVLGPAFQYDLNHLRDDVPCPAHDNRVANADILAVHLPHVVQSSVADGDAAHEYRLQARHRRDRARASHLELDVTYYRQRFLCGKFVGDRPTRSTRHKTELPLVVEPVDLVDDAVDVVAQLVATLANLPVIGETSIDALDDLPFRADLKAPQLQLIQYVAVAVRQLAMLDQPYRIHVNVQ